MCSSPAGPAVHSATVVVVKLRQLRQLTPHMLRPRSWSQILVSLPTHRQQSHTVWPSPVLTASCFLQGPPDSAPQLSQPDKVGWIRKFCGKGIFREIWKNRFVVLRGDQLFVCEKEVSWRGRGQQVTTGQD